MGRSSTIWIGSNTPAASLISRRLDHWSAAMAILLGWNHRLARSGWLLGSSPSLVDWALLPFVRQFRLADPARFDAEDRLTALHHWLARFLQGAELAAVMEPPWAARQPWCSPAWIYHLALEPEWQAACLEGSYRRSTRGLGLEQAGFVHASHAHQVAGTFRRTYADAGKVLLLTIDPRRLTEAGIEVREEALPAVMSSFPISTAPSPWRRCWRRSPTGRPCESVSCRDRRAGRGAGDETAAANPKAPGSLVPAGGGGTAPGGDGGTAGGTEGLGGADGDGPAPRHHARGGTGKPGGGNADLGSDLRLGPGGDAMPQGQAAGDPG
jgi:uncharacterized protein (DUF952 family)